jgi:hypothetical protein
VPAGGMAEWRWRGSAFGGKSNGYRRYGYRLASRIEWMRFQKGSGVWRRRPFISSLGTSVWAKRRWRAAGGTGGQRRWRYREEQAAQRNWVRGGRPSSVHHCACTRGQRIEWKCVSLMGGWVVARVGSRLSWLIHSDIRATNQAPVCRHDIRNHEEGRRSWRRTGARTSLFLV